MCVCVCLLVETEEKNWQIYREVLKQNINIFENEYEGIILYKEISLIIFLLSPSFSLYMSVFGC